MLIEELQGGIIGALAGLLTEAAAETMPGIDQLEQANLGPHGAHLPLVEFRLLARDNRVGADWPDDPVTLYHLGLAVGQQGRTAEALPLLRRSLEPTPADYSTRPKLYAMLSRRHQRLGQREQVLAICREGQRAHPDDVELLFMEALLLKEAKDLAGAEACLLKLLRLPPVQRFAAWDAGLAGYKARFFLGEVYEAQGRTEEAREQWRQVLKEQPGFTPAQQKLGDA